MTNYDDFTDWLAAHESFISMDDVQAEEQDEVRIIQGVGGNREKNTGRKLLIVTIPYVVNKKLVAQQLSAGYNQVAEMKAQIAFLEAELSAMEDNFHEMEN